MGRRARRGVRGEELEREDERSCYCNSNRFVQCFNSTMNWVLLLLTIVLIAVFYERFTGNYVPYIGETIGDVVDKVPKIDISGLLDRAKDWGFHFDDIFSFDAMDGNGTAPGWRSKEGEGLHLNIANGLTTDWHGFFYQAVSDWDAGSPDVLTLSTYVVDPDPECAPIQGEMKVCNADFGNTGWEGINEVMNNFVFLLYKKLHEHFNNYSIDAS